MAQMERNVNLEEIDSDALFGIDALKGQSILQKIIFFTCLGAGIVANVCMPMFLGTPRAVCIFIFLGLILIGIAFGCNYTQDMTYGRYMYCYFFKPVKTLRYESTEDIGRIKKKAEELKKEEELLLRKEREADPKAQKKLLIKLLAFVLVLVIAVVSALIYVKAVRPVSYHHEVIEETEVNSEQETELRTLALTLVEEFYENQGQGVLNNLNKRTYGNLSSDKDKVLQSIRESLSDFQDENGNEMTEEDKDMVLSFVNKEIWGYGLIDELIHDKTISDIKIHDANHIRIKREGKRESSTITFPSEESYERFVTRLLERNKVNLGTANAIQTFTDADQDDFILRLAVISGLLIVGGSPCVVIRKIPKDKYSLKELDEMGMFSDQVAKSMSEEEITDFYISEEKSEFDILLHRMIRGRGILFTGKGASGKTTLMNACLEKIPETDSVMICQENAELFDLNHPDLIAAHVMVNGGDSKVSYNLGDLTRVALLVDLDRVIVGEVKEGSEAAGLSKASMTGHKCWTSVHGESCEMAVEKMADYISQATGYGNREALKQLLGFEYVVHLRNFRVDEIVRIVDFDHEKGKLVLEKVYPFTKEKEAV